MVIKKLRINPDGVSNNTDTYNMDDIIDHITVDEHSEFLQKHLKPKVSQNNKVLSSTHWIPKLHKNPTKARFVIISWISLLKPLRKLIISVFQTMYQTFQDYSHKFCYFSGLNTLWTVFKVH